MDSPCIKQTVCKVLKIFQYGKYLVAYVLKRGFVPDICRLLCLFELQHILNGYTSVQHLPSKCQWKKQVKSAVLSRSMLLWRQRLYNDNDFVRFRKLHTSVAPAIVWKMSHSGCDLKRSGCCQLTGSSDFTLKWLLPVDW